MRYIYLLLIPTLLFAAKDKEPFVLGSLFSQLGNQFFQVAAAEALAWDHGATAIFPEFNSSRRKDLKINREKIFFRLDTRIAWTSVKHQFTDHGLGYKPIEYKPCMQLTGNFQSYKYFYHHKQRIMDLFAPSSAILNYLHHRYSEIIQHPKSVAVHVRTYFGEHPIYDNIIGFMGMEYFEKAMALFPEDSIFVIFSDKIEWCKKNFENLPYNMIFMDKEPYYHDFYLMTLCKHNIISNSTFSWWAAFLNQNVDKTVVMPKNWYKPALRVSSDNLVLPEKNWVVLE